MAVIQTVVDHDRNVRFDHPAGWSVDVQPSERGRPRFITLWSPAAPDGGPGVLAAVAVEWHQEEDLSAFVDRRLEHQSKSASYVLHSRSGGRHPVSRMPAMTATCEFEINNVIQRKDMIFVEASPGVVLSASAMCPSASRHLWRDGCKVIFGSLQLADPERPPVAGDEAVIGVGLPSGQHSSVERLWLLFDSIGNQLVEANRTFLEDDADVVLGAAAHFEMRAFLLSEMLVAMTMHSYPAARREQILRPFTHAITGRWPVEPLPPDGPLARLRERGTLYKMADAGKSVMLSTQRMALFADLLTTSGAEHAPVPIFPKAIYDRLNSGPIPKLIVFKAMTPMALPFRFSVDNLFRRTPDITSLPVAQIDERFAMGHAKAVHIYKS